MTAASQIAPAHGPLSPEQELKALYSLSDFDNRECGGDECLHWVMTVVHNVLRPGTPVPKAMLGDRDLWMGAMQVMQRMQHECSARQLLADVLDDEFSIDHLWDVAGVPGDVPEMKSQRLGLILNYLVYTGAATRLWDARRQVLQAEAEGDEETEDAACSRHVALFDECTGGIRPGIELYVWLPVDDVLTKCKEHQRRVNQAARRIQGAWRRAVSDPRYQVCVTRLLREAEDLVVL